MKNLLYILLFVPLALFGQDNLNCEVTTLDILGPYFLEGTPITLSIVDEDYEGDLLFLSGNLMNNCEIPISNAIIDLWQTDENGEYDYDGYSYRGKILTDVEGNYSLETIIPGKYMIGSGFRPAHIHLKVVVEGNDELVTQIYFEGDTDIASDPWASSPSAVNRIIPLNQDVYGDWFGSFDIVLEIEDFTISTFNGCTNPTSINYNLIATEDDGSCMYNTYPLVGEGFKSYLQANYPQTIVNDSLNIIATTGITDINIDSLEISSLDGLHHFTDLINLNCVANNLTELPELPTQIEYINCQWNQIETLPTFPQSLKNFDGRHNLITIVPALPNTMEILRVCFNEITSIPVLPDSLKILFCAYNYEQLTYLPDFPDHLEQVLCFDNEISEISEIPETMFKFMMQNNSISHIPNIPLGVSVLNLTNNPIVCVNNFPEQFESQLGEFPPCSFLDEYIALLDSLSSLQQALDTWNITIDLSAGWNMFGYGCPDSINIAEGLSNHTESVHILKDNDGSVYLPEFGFNGIGDFTPGFGYQIKVTEAIEDFSLCDWYVNDIHE